MNCIRHNCEKSQCLEKARTANSAEELLEMAKVEHIELTAEEAEKALAGLQLIQFVRHKHPDVKSFLIGTDEDLSGFWGVVSEDVTGILTYPFIKKTIRDTLRKNGL